jgi:hypothetical protein
MLTEMLSTPAGKNTRVLAARVAVDEIDRVSNLQKWLSQLPQYLRRAKLSR